MNMGCAASSVDDGNGSGEIETQGQRDDEYETQRLERMRRRYQESEYQKQANKAVQCQEAYSYSDSTVREEEFSPVPWPEVGRRRRKASASDTAGT
jgi:sRNA-binding protein